MRINDEGSRPQFVRVGVQGVPMNGVVDTGAGITIINGPMFKRVAPVARLKKRDFKSPDKTPHTYGQKPFKLDGRLDLGLTFGDKAMNIPIYVKMDAKEDLLLSEGLCRQLNIVTYHPEVGSTTKSTARGQSLGPGQSDGKAADAVTDTDTVTDSVTVKLVKTVHALPSQSVMAQEQLSPALFPLGLS